MDFNLNSIKLGDHVKLDIAKQKAMDRYYSAGYAKPVFINMLINDIYTDLYAKEVNKATRECRDVGEAVSEKIGFMKEMTITKAYNHLYTSFKNGEESVDFKFENGKPDKETADFFNLEDSTGAELNFSRTNEIRLPKSFGKVKECVFTATPEGDGMIRDGKGYGIFDPLLTQDFMPSFNESYTQE